MFDPNTVSMTTPKKNKQTSLMEQFNNSIMTNSGKLVVLRDITPFILDLDNSNISIQHNAIRQIYQCLVKSSNNINNSFHRESQLKKLVTLNKLEHLIVATESQIQIYQENQNEQNLEKIKEAIYILLELVSYVQLDIIQSNGKM